MKKKIGRADLHIHSDFSPCAEPSVEEILEYAENKTNLDVIAICDHNTLAGAKKAVEIARINICGLKLLSVRKLAAKKDIF